MITGFENISHKQQSEASLDARTQWCIRNEKADLQARLETKIPLFEPKPVVELSEQSIKLPFKNWCKEEYKNIRMDLVVPR